MQVIKREGWDGVVITVRSTLKPGFPSATAVVYVNMIDRKEVASRRDGIPVTIVGAVYAYETKEEMNGTKWDAISSYGS